MGAFAHIVADPSGATVASAAGERDERARRSGDLAELRGRADLRGSQRIWQQPHGGGVEILSTERRQHGRITSSIAAASVSWLRLSATSWMPAADRVARGGTSPSSRSSRNRLGGIAETPRRHLLAGASGPTTTSPPGARTPRRSRSARCPQPPRRRAQRVDERLGATDGVGRRVGHGRRPSARTPRRSQASTAPARRTRSGTSPLPAYGFSNQRVTSSATDNCVSSISGSALRPATSRAKPLATAGGGTQPSEARPNALSTGWLRSPSTQAASAASCSIDAAVASLFPR